MNNFSFIYIFTIIIGFSMISFLIYFLYLALSDNLSNNAKQLIAKILLKNNKK
jgi:hypothetical protein